MDLLSFHLATPLGMGIRLYRSALTINLNFMLCSIYLGIKYFLHFSMFGATKQLWSTEIIFNLTIKASLIFGKQFMVGNLNLLPKVLEF
jgi:hypothetical protein